MKNFNEVITEVGYHTVKKGELIEEYVSHWSRILGYYNKCDELVYIDCMSNCGEYKVEGTQVHGSGPRVFEIFCQVSHEYPNKKFKIIFNDLSKDRIDHLKSIISSTPENLEVIYYNEDANCLLNKINYLTHLSNTHYLLIYDPYEASIDWDVIKPFFNSWGEVIINHMVSDSARAVKMVKSDKAKKKYENTYKLNIEDLIPYGSNKSAYETRVREIINMQVEKRTKYYISSFPFFNKKNALMYDLIHCTSNIEGFKLFKRSAWEVFEGKSSNKNVSGNKQFTFNFDNDYEFYKIKEDKYCYNLTDIAEFLYQNYKGKENVSLKDMWGSLDNHPIFPSNCFKNEIKSILKINYGVILHRSSIDFSGS